MCILGPISVVGLFTTILRPISVVSLFTQALLLHIIAPAPINYKPTLVYSEAFLLPRQKAPTPNFRGKKNTEYYIDARMRMLALTITEYYITN